MFLYNLGILLFYAVANIASLFKPKARLWVNGRKKWQKQLQEKISAHRGKKLIWFHVASLGEFEQGRPVIEAFRQRYPDTCLLISFFSSSGYEIQKHYEHADIVCYLPVDLPSQAKQFIEMINPTVVFFIKYEFWLNYLRVLGQKRINTYLISAVFHTQQPFFKWYGGMFRKALETYTTIFVQDKNSAISLQKIGYERVEIIGDTRVDRVITIAQENTKDVTFLETFKGNQRLWIVGSSWPKDDVIVIETFIALKKKNADLKLVIAPHVVDKSHVAVLCQRLSSAGLTFSLFTEKSVNAKADVFVLNTIGYLSTCYRLADVVYIGGGWNGGIHSTLEPAAYHKPLFFGPNYNKFTEAVELIQMKGACSITQSNQLIEKMEAVLNNEAMFQTTSNAVRMFIETNKGATEKLMTNIKL
jgi:3-deoxy-D-manno-octulosonic-acid transferase